VPKIVETYIWYGLAECPPEKRLVGAVAEVGRVDKRAALRGEDEAARLVEGTHPLHHD
jgi:hypothetical protein